MPRVALTDLFCKTAKPLGVRTDYFDETIAGLALRVTEQGHRSWSYLFTSPRDGKRARATIGTYPATSLAAARGKALEAKGHVEAGRDPRLVLAGQATAGMTVAGLVDAYLADPEKAALRSKAEIDRRLRKNVVPVIGEIKLAELRRRDVRNVTDAILKRKRMVEATRVFEDVRAMVRWAVQNEYLDANPLDGMGKPAEPTSSNRVLSDDEIRTLWTGLADALARSEQCQHIVKLCLVTGQRVGEVAGITSAELDLERASGVCPAPAPRTVTPMSCPCRIWRSTSSGRQASFVAFTTAGGHDAQAQLKMFGRNNYFRAATARFRRSRSLERSCAPIRSARSGRLAASA